MEKTQKSLLTVVFFLTFLPCYSQIIAITYYDDLWQLTPKNFGKYFRVGVLDTVKYQYYGEIKDHYISGKLQMKGKFQANVKVDTFYFYYPSGKLKTKGTYQNNVRYGIWTNYYENGKIKDKVAFQDGFLGVLEYYDENENPKLSKGTGVWEIAYINDQVKEQITLKGGFKDTLRHGTWTYYKKSLVPGNAKEAKLECSEEYDHGKFVKGKYYWADGKTDNLKSPVMQVLPESQKFENTEKWKRSQYASIEAYPFLKFLPKVDSTVFPVDQVAQFPGGLDGLTRFFGRNINLTKEYIASQKGRSTGFQLLVDENGKATIKEDHSKNSIPMFPTNKIYYEQVIKAIEKLPTWQPAKLNNKNVKNYFILRVMMDNGKISVFLKSVNELRQAVGKANNISLSQPGQR